MSKVTKDDVALFVSQYKNGKTMSDIALAYGCNRSTVKYWLEREGIDFRSTSDLARSASGHYLDEHVFDAVNFESSYWVGFLMADGAIHKNTVALCLNNQDSWHLEKFRHFMSGTQKIIEIGSTESVRYAFDSAYVVAKLAEYGVCQRKSHTAAAPDCMIDNRHFWRGVVDGDGYLATASHRGKMQARFELVGTRTICLQFSDYVRRNIIAHGAAVRQRKTIYGIAFSGRTAQAVVDHLYNSATIALDRKATISYEISLL